MVETQSSPVHLRSSLRGESYYRVYCELLKCDRMFFGVVLGKVFSSMGRSLGKVFGKVLRPLLEKSFGQCLG